MLGHQVGCFEIAARCEDRLTAERRQRVDRAIAEIELSPMAHAFSKASKCGNRRPLDCAASNDTKEQSRAPACS